MRKTRFLIGLFVAGLFAGACSADGQSSPHPGSRRNPGTGSGGNATVGSGGGNATGGAVGSGGSGAGSTTGGTSSTAGSSNPGEGGAPTTGAGGSGGNNAAGTPGSGGTAGQATAGSGGSGVAGSASHSETECTRSCWNFRLAACTGEEASNVADNDEGTRWTSGTAMVGGETFEIDLGSEVELDGLKVVTTNDDYMRSYKIALSSDGSAFTEVASGDGQRTTDIGFAKRAARYIRIEQTGTSGQAWWSIQEIFAYCPGEDTCEGSPPGGQTQCE